MRDQKSWVSMYFIKIFMMMQLGTIQSFSNKSTHYAIMSMRHFLFINCLYLDNCTNLLYLLMHFRHEKVTSAHNVNSVFDVTNGWHVRMRMIEVGQWPPGYDAFQITINGLAQIFKVWQRKYFRFGTTRIQIAVFLNSFVVANS